MRFQQKIKIFYQKMRRVPMKYYFVGAIFCVMVSYLVAFRPQTLSYSYGGNNCDNRLVLLPGMFAQSGSDKYQIEARGGWHVAGQQLTATKLCFAPESAPDEGSSETVAFAPWGGWLARFHYVVEAGAHPSVSTAVLEQPIPASRDLQLPLSEPDATFSYKLVINEAKADCLPTEDGVLTCDVPDLKLKQGAEYRATLDRYFKGQAVEEVASMDVKTLSPLSITKSSIGDNTTVYDKPASVVLTTDKPVRQADLEVWRVDGDAPEKIVAKTTVKDTTVTVEFTAELPRQASIVLKTGTLEAADGSTPLDEQLMTFKTSGGPKVTGVNVGNSGVMVGTQIVVSFDQELSADQDFGSLVTLAGGVSLQGVRGNQMLFSTANVNRCAGVNITLKPDIKSPHDISGQSAWKYSGRMSCYTVSTIGYSSQGRPINAYHFGTSGPSVIYTGAIHGNEASTKYLMDRWIQELDANPGKLPAGKRVIVVPVINPDGFAAGARVNARNVDLNRNFGVSDWQKDIQHTNGQPFPGGGGNEPMSEPETKAIAGFVARERPELVISYHSIGGMVISNQRGQASVRASQYSSLSGYRLSGGDSSEFGYQISGTADDYYGEKLGVASILIELGSHYYHQFERNQAAMWAMMR